MNINKQMKKNLFKLPSNNFIFRYCSIAIITLCVVFLCIPTVFNYPPESINTPFDTQLSDIPYYMQVILGSILGVFMLYIVIKILMKDIDKWYDLPECKKYTDRNLIIKIRKKCLRLPYILLIIEFILPTVCAFIIFFSTGSHHTVLFVKLCIFLFSVGLMLAVISYIFSKELYNQVLADTYKKGDSIGLRIGLRTKIFIQILPLVLLCLLITSLLAYSKIVIEKSDIIFNIYLEKLNSYFDTSKVYSIDEISDILNDIPLQSTSDSIFIINNDKTLFFEGKTPLSDFITKYTLQISERYNGRTYDAYGIDVYGSTIKLETQDGYVYAGILYTVTIDGLLTYFILSSLILLIGCIIVVTLFTKSLIDDLHFITNKFKDIYKTANIHLLAELPIISNDEIGDLSHEFNKIQTLTKENIENIHNKQDRLVEKERLASLGQMIGGIAHNLKTPIMSIGGASEGLSDLIKEYDNSIGDPEVTNEDHHEIANEMNIWINKIKLHTEYMSDVITAVKGQAVRLSDEQIDSFTIDDLLKHVTILMKHELKNALIDLNIIQNIDTSMHMYGNINILVQVINNIISNAIQAYNGQTNKSIDFEIREEGAYILFKISDYASGIKKEIQEKLFKEMVTTKGKNGTGLGLFMSYSTIKANFNGQLSFESEIGKGTTFNILIPKVSI